MLSVDLKSVYLTSLHFKLCLMKNFVKAMEVIGNRFRYVHKRFCSEKSDVKLMAGIFIRSEIRRLIKNLELKHHLNHLELLAWESFTQFLENFLGNHRNDNYS